MAPQLYFPTVTGETPHSVSLCNQSLQTNNLRRTIVTIASRSRRYLWRPACSSISFRCHAIPLVPAFSTNTDRVYLLFVQGVEIQFLSKIREILVVSFAKIYYTLISERSRFLFQIIKLNQDFIKTRIVV